MRSQFIHMQAYAVAAKGTSANVGFVLDEASRRPGACHHVERPMRPVLVGGCTIEALRTEHARRVASARIQTKTGPRRIRGNQSTLLTVIASYPDDDGLDLWQRSTVKWLRNQFGDNLKCVIRHDDESHPHLHAYILPDATNMRALDLHPGDIAKREAMNSGATNRAGDIAYREAMRRWQDTYWLDVGAPCGLARVGPARRRMTRDEWKERQRLDTLYRRHAAEMKRIRSSYVQRMERQHRRLLDLENVIPQEVWQDLLRRAQEQLAEPEPEMPTPVPDISSLSL